MNSREMRNENEQLKIQREMLEKNNQEQLESVGILQSHVKELEEKIVKLTEEKAVVADEASSNSGSQSFDYSSSEGEGVDTHSSGRGSCSRRD